jgi:hypothetical protein
VNAGKREEGTLGSGSTSLLGLLLDPASAPSRAPDDVAVTLAQVGNQVGFGEAPLVGRVVRRCSGALGLLLGAPGHADLIGRGGAEVSGVWWPRPCRCGRVDATLPRLAPFYDLVCIEFLNRIGAASYKRSTAFAIGRLAEPERITRADWELFARNTAVPPSASRAAGRGDARGRLAGARRLRRQTR